MNSNPASNPLPKFGNKISGFLNRLKSNKKLALTVLAIIFLIAALIYFGFSSLKNRFLPNLNIPSPFNQTSKLQLPSSMVIKTTKVSFTLSEKIPVSVAASSNGESITGFDTVIEYDPQFLTISEKKKPPLDSFIYYGKNSESRVQVSAILKPDSTASQKFDNTTLFDVEFTPKKAGKTTLKVISMPNSTSESNLLNGESKDILQTGRGVEITINWRWMIENRR